LLCTLQVKIVAVGADYTSFEGYKDEATGETVIGLSYAKLCQHVKPGGRILIADGSLTVEVGWVGWQRLGWGLRGWQSLLCLILVVSASPTSSPQAAANAAQRSARLPPIHI
jgi:hypothetical protein